MTIDQVIQRTFSETLVSQGVVKSSQLLPETVLLQSGLDSLGFAILVSQLEADLGYDPFVLEQSPMYPRTYAEFLALYEKHAAQRKKV
jgi:hypothetical protein